MPAMPPPTISTLGLMGTFLTSSGLWCGTRSMAARARAMALRVASVRSVCTQELCSRVLTIWKKNGFRPAGLGRLAERVFVQQRRAGFDDNPVEAVLPDVLLDQLLAGIGAHVLVVPRDRHVGQRGRVLGDRLDIHHAGDVGAAVADVVADANGFVSSWVQSVS